MGLALPAFAQTAPKRAPDSVKIIEDALGSLRHLTDADIRTLISSGQVTLGSCTVENLATIQTALGVMKQVVDEERKLGVSGSFSMSDTQSRTVRDADGSIQGSEKQSLSTSVSMSNGRYPFEVDLRSSVSISKSNPGAIQEDISSLFMSVDYHPHSLRYETFGFVNRTTDAFLSIDQRYELGGGLVLNQYAWWTNEGGGIRNKLGTDESLYSPDADWVACYNEIQQAIGGRGEAGASLFEALRHARDVSERSLRKDHARARFALLIGALGELEQSSLAGMSLHDRGWRFEVRPTVEWKPLDVLSLRVDWYIKARIGGFDASAADLHAAKQQLCAEMNNVLPGGRCGKDIRSELLFTITQRFRGISFELRHERLRDYLPPFVVFPEGDPRDPVVAAWRRNNTRLAVVIAL